jgi:PAS domain S-box-containing protein
VTAAVRVLLVALDDPTRRLVERGARLAGDVQIVEAGEEDAVSAAFAGTPPAAAVISQDAAEPIRLAQSLAGIDRETSITILCEGEREEELRQSLRFAPLITPHTTCRSADDVEQLGVDLFESALAVTCRREHHTSVAAAGERMLRDLEAPTLRREALGRVVESAPIGILSLTSDRVVAAWNAYAAQIVGEREADVIGRPVGELFDPAEHDSLATLLAPGTAAQEGRSAVLRRLRRGEEQHIEVTAGPMVSAAGERGTLLVLSDATGRVVAERARRRAEQAQALLARTGELLDASLDAVDTLQRIASLAVPAHAELCIIDVLTDDNRIDGVAFAAADPGVRRAVQEVRRRYPLDPRGPHPVARVLRTGAAELLEEMTDATYPAIAASDEHLELMRRLRYRSAAIAPMIGRGRTHGVISLLSLQRERRYSSDDLAVLQDVSRRAALALDNARLYARERHIAETLQRSLLPAVLPDLPGVTLVAHYEPAQGDIGGDWYDVIALPDGRVACVVGDIVGRGIGAAAVMGQLRNAVRAYVLERESAAEVVDAVDRLTGSLGVGQMATLAYLIFDPARGEVEVCCAGHPPPLRLQPGAGGAYVMSGRSAPLGVGRALSRRAEIEPFPAGSQMLMYTDGLIERRGSTIDDGLDRLRHVADAAAAASGGDIAELARRVLGDLRPDSKGDDVALLAVRAEPL